MKFGELRVKNEQTEICHHQNTGSYEKRFSLRRFDMESSHTKKTMTEKNPIERLQDQALKSMIVEAIKTVYDPEIPVNIYELGLIYGIEIGPDQNVDITMTLTSPACPVAETLVSEVSRKAAGIDGVQSVNVDVTFDPPWNPDKMSEAAKLELGMD